MLWGIIRNFIMRIGFYFRKEVVVVRIRMEERNVEK